RPVPFPASSEEREPAGAELEGVVLYFASVDSRFEHLPRIIVNDNRAIVFRRTHHQGTDSAYVRKGKYLMRCLEKPGVTHMAANREMLDIVDGGIRQDRRIIARTKVQQRLTRPNEVMNEIFPLHRAVPEFDKDRWAEARAGAPKP
ncbi:unnamed protein product, partial [Amoebophrya sp. A25]